MHFSAFFACFIAICYASRSINLIKISPSEVFLESTGPSDSVWYGLSLFNNVLATQIYATTAGSKQCKCNKPVTYYLSPAKMLEFNGSISAIDTDSYYRFKNRDSNNTYWGEGLTVKSFNVTEGNSTVEVWEFAANYSKPSAPKFNALAYLSSAPVEYQNLTLTPDALAMKMSILDYPFALANSSLGLQEFYINGTGINNVTNNNPNQPELNNVVGYVQIGDTALVDGKSQPVQVSINEVVIDEATVKNSTMYDLSQYDVQSFLIGFNDSFQAKNVTFNQRLGINMTALDKMYIAQNAAPGTDGNSWFPLACFLSTLVVALPMFFI